MKFRTDGLSKSRIDSKNAFFATGHQADTITLQVAMNLYALQLYRLRIKICILQRRVVKGHS
jgi:hypothetical protein